MIGHNKTGFTFVKNIATASIKLPIIHKCSRQRSIWCILDKDHWCTTRDIPNKQLCHHTCIAGKTLLRPRNRQWQLLCHSETKTDFGCRSIGNGWTGPGHKWPSLFLSWCHQHNVESGNACGKMGPLLCCLTGQLHLFF